MEDIDEQKRERLFESKAKQKKKKLHKRADWD